MSFGFSKGDKVHCINAEGTNDRLVKGAEYEVEYVAGEDPKLVGVPFCWMPERFEKVEPLKEGDAVLVWARVRGFADDRAVHVDVTTRHARPLRLVPHADTIVRPDAGQVPPWVKPEAAERTLSTSADVARACKNFADALRPAAEAAERAVEQMMRAVREGGAS